MVEDNKVTRRKFIGTTASAGAVLAVGGANPITEAAPEITPQGDEMVRYVGYGSNLNVGYTIADLLPNGRFLMRAYIPNYQVQFRKWSNNSRGGISNIMEVPGEMVEAAMYECPRSDLDTLDYRLDYYVPDYKREVFRVMGEDGQWYQASLYRLWEPKGPFPPARRYVEGMLEGARQLELSPAYIERIEGFLRESIVAPD
jgi:hypothetical protein